MANRKIALDTETTGLDPARGHRIIEIACVEINEKRNLTGNNFHVYVNPSRFIDRGAQAVHGITSEFLADKPYFKDIYKDFLNYIQGAELVIHNAPFDVGFLNYELRLCGEKKCQIGEYASVFDTLAFARKKHPGQRNSLDALCRRYEIDNSQRDLHGALIDAQLLMQVYLAMTGGQISLFGGDLADNDKYSDSEFDENVNQKIGSEKKSNALETKPYTPTSIIYATEEELKTHDDFLRMMQKRNGGKVLWQSDEEKT